MLFVIKVDKRLHIQAKFIDLNHKPIIDTHATTMPVKGAL